jgi:hypothetical protein
MCFANAISDKNVNFACPRTGFKAKSQYNEIWALSDRVAERFYNPVPAKYFENIELIFGCGDMTGWNKPV